MVPLHVDSNERARVIGQTESLIQLRDFKALQLRGDRMRGRKLRTDGANKEAGLQREDLEATELLSEAKAEKEATVNDSMLLCFRLGPIISGKVTWLSSFPHTQ